MTIKRPSTLGALRQSGWKSRNVREELRQNLLRKLRAGEQIFPNVIGFEKSVIPQLTNAILSRHHFILLGLRGQAKTRIIRQLYLLLDEFQPVISGSLLNEDPMNPITPASKKLLAECGDDLPVSWRNHRDRFGEKLATPDVSIADLIGDIDPIKAAREKLDISNEEVIHWGIIPRTNRGIFAVNELPDLQPRIQVGLLNILEESDIQVRGFPLRIPLDLCMVFSANPEDYTNRGSIITPLKDRIDSQITTHYPRSLEDARKITSAEVVISNDEIKMPALIRDIIELVVFEARESEYVDQSSGVSARVSISSYENCMSNIERRACLNGKGRPDLYPRLCDLYAIIPAVSGKIELVYEGEQEGASLVVNNLIGRAIDKVFRQHFPEPAKGSRSPDEAPQPNPYESLTDFFSAGRHIDLADDMPLQEYQRQLKSVPGLEKIVASHFPTDDKRELLLRMELVLEGLYHNNIIAREDLDSTVRYGDIFSGMMRGMGKKG